MAGTMTAAVSVANCVADVVARANVNVDVEMYDDVARAVSRPAPWRM